MYYGMRDGLNNKVHHEQLPKNTIVQSQLTAPIIEWAKVAKYSTGIMTCKACLCRWSRGLLPENFEK